MTTLEDITIDKIDFQWIQQCVKVNYLKKAIRVIETDGDYYPELKQACFKRIEELDPRQKRKNFDNNIPAAQKEKILKDLEEWENSLNNKNIFNNESKEEEIDAEKYFEKTEVLTVQQKIKLAEAQKNKGNEAVKSKDFDEAISFYNKSLEYDSKNAATYCNRALAYLKKKQFGKVIEDCTSCLKLNPKYIKAYHRRSKAYKEQKNNVAAYRDLKTALGIEPQNSELNGELKELRSEMTQGELKEVDGVSKQSKPAQFKRIVIEEEDDD